MLTIQNYTIIIGNTCFSEMTSLMVFNPEMAMFLYVTFHRCFKMKAFNRHRGEKMSCKTVTWLAHIESLPRFEDIDRYQRYFISHT